MMTQAGFATAGYLIFWNFNRIELLSAALVLTGVLVISNNLRSANNGVVVLLLYPCYCWILFDAVRSVRWDSCHNEPVARGLPAVKLVAGVPFRLVLATVKDQFKRRGALRNRRVTQRRTNKLCRSAFKDLPHRSGAFLDSCRKLQKSALTTVNCKIVQLIRLNTVHIFKPVVPLDRSEGGLNKSGILGWRGRN